MMRNRAFAQPAADVRIRLVRAGERFILYSLAAPSGAVAANMRYDVSLLETLQTDMKEAMKARQADRLGVIRMLISDIKKILIDGQKSEITEDEVIAFLSTQAKRRRDSIDQYTKGAREDLAAIEQAELAIIETYLPQQLTVDEATDITREVIAAVGATSIKDMSKVMAGLMPRLKGRFPGKDVKPILESLLNG
jgi:hypothetical protein